MTLPPEDHPETRTELDCLIAGQQAAELDSDFPEAYRAIAAVAVQTEEYGIAADAAEKLLEYQPSPLISPGIYHGRRMAKIFNLQSRM